MKQGVYEGEGELCKLGSFLDLNRVSCSVAACSVKKRGESPKGFTKVEVHGEFQSKRWFRLCCYCYPHVIQHVCVLRESVVANST